MTVQQVVDMGLWEKVCQYAGWDIWSLKEGKISYDEKVEFDTEFKKECSEYDKPVPIMRDKESLYAYHISCSPRWKGEYFGVVFAENKKMAKKKLEKQYPWVLSADIEIDNSFLVDLNKFKEGCFEIGSHQE